MKFVSDGNLTYGAFEQNTVYSIFISACTKNSSKKFEGNLFKENNCIKSYSLFYSITTLPPQNISDMHLETISYDSIKLNWVYFIYNSFCSVSFTRKRTEIFFVEKSVLKYKIKLSFLANSYSSK